MRRYWLSVHWPPEIGNRDSFDVWVQNEHDDIARQCAVGDIVVIYQGESGPVRIEKRPDGTTHKRRRMPGKGGIIGFSRVVRPLFEEPDSRQEEYTDGTKRWWRWHAICQPVNTRGFLDRNRMNSILNYKPAYNYRGFNRGRGIKELTEAEYEQLRDKFSLKIRASDKESDHEKDPNAPHVKKYPHGEGKEHLALKEYVHKCPNRVFRNTVFTHSETEYAFGCTGDRIDVLLIDADNQPYAIEVEVDVHDDEPAGLLQAIKYKHMYAAFQGRTFEEVQGVLVAYSITPKMKERCHAYEVTPIEVARRDVQRGS